MLWIERSYSELGSYWRSVPERPERQIYAEL